MNIMIVSLIERTREIGVLKALGMKSRTVLSTFLSESALIVLVGSVVGIVLGWSVANVVELAHGRSKAVQVNGNGIKVTPIVSPEPVILALAFGIVVSVLFAIYPAWPATNLKVVEALRYE